jgi:adenylosuccinate synthase
MGKLMVVVGGQFGSEAKGACAAALAARSDDPLVIRTGGPNAGHTVWGGEPHQEYKLRQLPTAAISNPGARLAIAAGSVVDPELLHKEINETGTGRHILVDEMATVLEPRHIDREALDSGLYNWSTQKGIGAARADRIARRARVWREIPPPPQTAACDVAHLARTQLQAGGDVIIEAAQGYGLGLHTTYYPKTTSSDCRAIDALAAVGISPWSFQPRTGFPAPETTPELQVWVVMRPYPIRVAGESGPLRNEVSWEQLGLPEERTTVTNKVRRVGLWDAALAEAAIRANGGPSPAVRVWFSMVDQVIPELKGQTDATFRASGKNPEKFELTAAVRHQIETWQSVVRQAGAPVHVMGTGPDSYITVGWTW